MDRQTITTYDRFAKEYDLETTTFWATFPREFIDEFSKAIPKAGPVLDAGSGPGRDAELLREYDLEVTCFDASASMIEITKQKGFESIQGDLLSLPFANEHFTGIWSYTSLVHLPREEIAVAISEFARVLTNGGILGLGMIEGDYEEILSSSPLVPAPRLFTYFTMAELAKTLEPYFSILYSKEMQPNRKRYLHIVAQKK